MRLNILLTTGAIISSVFALPTSSQTLSQRARNEKGTEGDDQHDLLDRLVNPAWALSAAAAGYLGYRGLRYLLSPEGQRAKQNWIRYLEEWNRRLEENAEQSRQRRKEFLQERRLLTLSNLHGYLRRTGDDITVQAPNGQEVQLTWTEKVHLTDCIRIVKFLKVDSQSKFQRCFLYAKNPGIKIEDVLDVDKPLEVLEIPPKGDDSIDPGSNQFSKVVVDQGRQVLGKVGGNVQKIVLRVMAPLASAKKNKGGFIPLPSGLQSAPGVGAVSPL